MAYFFDLQEGKVRTSLSEQVPLVRNASYPDVQVLPTWPTGAGVALTPLGSLGVAPVLAVGVVGVTVAISALAALIQNQLDDDWTDTNVFNDHARTIHSAMLAIQCVLGGAHEPLVDMLGNTICEAGTKPSCAVKSATLQAWRSLRDGFSAFWQQATQSNYGVVSITEAEAARLKQYGRQFAAFYDALEVECANQVQLPPRPKTVEELEPPVPDKDPPWLSAVKWSVVGIAGLTLFAVVKTVKDWNK